MPHLTPIIFHTTHITQLISHIPQLTNSSFTQLITYTSTHKSSNSSHTRRLSPFTLCNRHATNLLLLFSPSFSSTLVFLTHKATHVGLSGPLIFLCFWLLLRVVVQAHDLRAATANATPSEHLFTLPSSHPALHTLHFFSPHLI